jgi:hypothetical protein
LAALNIELYLYPRRELGMGRGRIVAALGSVLSGMRVAGRQALEPAKLCTVGCVARAYNLGSETRRY